MCSASEAFARVREEPMIVRTPPVHTVNIGPPGNDDLHEGEQRTYYNDIDRWLGRPLHFRSLGFQAYFANVTMQKKTVKKPLPRIAIEQGHDDFCVGANFLLLPVFVHPRDLFTRITTKATRLCCSYATRPRSFSATLERNAFPLDAAPISFALQ